jgi:hypothetical protein
MKGGSDREKQIRPMFELVRILYLTFTCLLCFDIMFSSRELTSLKW